MQRMLNASIFKYHICIFLLFGITPTLSDNGNCGIEFKGKCWCGIAEYNRVPQYIVNCTNEGFSNTAVLEHMPADVEVLIFTGKILVHFAIETI